jgi:peptidoglycan/xylan/chitin deacetylase (PgdA/CDA1 family)
VQLALKIDVDTYEGVTTGAARLASFLHSQKIPASFFVSLGPDNSGRAVTRAFRHPGFLKKMWRTKAVSVYGWRTALSGTLFPARPMGNSFGALFRQWRDWGFEVSPHGYDHILWHDQAAGWDEKRAASELEKIVETHRDIFGKDPASFAAPGWQAGAGTWKAMEPLKLLYHSDTRGTHPYFPKLGEAELKTLEIPTTLPTWDEMLAWDGMTPEALAPETMKRLDPNRLNVWTVHAELEGTVYFPRFHELVENARREGVEWVFLPEYAKELLSHPKRVPCDTMMQGTLPGRAGTVTCQHG